MLNFVSHALELARVTVFPSHAKVHRASEGNDTGASDCKKTSESSMSWKTILFIGAIAVAAVYVFNKFVGPRIGVQA